MNYYFNLFQKRWKPVIALSLLCSLISIFVSLLFPFKYRADTQVLIISKSRYGVDPYTVVKSAERVAENIIEIMKSSDFYTKVRSQEGFGMDWSSFDRLNERERRKLWDKTIKPSVVYGTGILNISVRYKDKEETGLIASAAARALTEKGWEYVGGDVTIKVINEAMVSKWPATPNFFVNAVLGFLIGALLMTVLLSERDQHKNLF